MVCPEVADEANPGKEASPTGRAEVGRRCAVGAGGRDTTDQNTTVPH